jgi:hypothetical protein
MRKKMTDLREILREEYIKQINQLDLRMLLGMVEEVMGTPPQITEETAPTIGADVDEEETLSMILRMIPNIEVSEIGWSDVGTVDGDPIFGPQRKLLEDYLENIAGATFKQKIANVSRFYSDGASVIGETKDQSRPARMQQAVSYLVFYKTLTKVITNFNASSAGFSFESFLSALVKGKQIPTGNKTIADYTDNLTEGTEIPVSLKLYREGGLEVGGSYTDLVNDMVNPKNPNAIGGGMRYVICTKNLEGKKLEQQGEITFWQFDFTLDNIIWILMNSKDKSAECIRLPQEAVSLITGKGAERSDYSNMLNLPQKAVMPSADEIHTNVYLPKLKGQIALAQQRPANKDTQRLAKFLFRSEREVGELADQLNWDSNDALFKELPPIEIEHEDTGEIQIEPQGKIRGRTHMLKSEVDDFTTKWVDTTIADLTSDPQKNPPLHDYLASLKDRAKKTLLSQLITDISFAIRAANQGATKHNAANPKPKGYEPMRDPHAGVLSVFRASEIEKERSATIKGILDAEGGFLTPQASAQAYFDAKNPEFKKALLQHSLGYLNTMHFSMNQTQATNTAAPGPNKEVRAPTDKNPRNTKIVKGGTGAIKLGSIQVGAYHVGKAMEGVRKILNEEILEIFKSLKILSDSLNTFFAKGLKDDTLAAKAVNNAHNIGSKKVLGGVPMQSSSGQTAIAEEKKNK